MKLEEYLKKHSMTHRELSEKVGVSRVQITRIVNGVQYPSPSLMKRIIQTTNKEVTYEDLIER